MPRACGGWESAFGSAPGGCEGGVGAGVGGETSVGEGGVV